MILAHIWRKFDTHFYEAITMTNVVEKKSQKKRNDLLNTLTPPPRLYWVCF